MRKEKNWIKSSSNELNVSSIDNHVDVNSPAEDEVQESLLPINMNNINNDEL